MPSRVRVRRPAPRAVVKARTRRCGLQKRRGRRAGPWTDTQRLADRAVPGFARVFMRAVRGVAPEIRAVVEAGGDPRAVVAEAEQVWRNAMADLEAQFAGAFARIIQTSGTAELGRLVAMISRGVRKQRARAAVSTIRFDLRNEAARRAAQAYAYHLIREISPDTVAAIRAIILATFEEGITTQRAARLIEAAVGLTSRQEQAVFNYWRRLDDDDMTDLDDAERLAAQYAERLRRERAITIARTETMRAGNAGIQAAWQQAREDGALTDADLKDWIVTDDDALCEDCAPMAGHPPIPLDASFDTPLGSEMAPPLHPRCRCVLGIVMALD